MKSRIRTVVCLMTPCSLVKVYRCFWEDSAACMINTNDDKANTFHRNVQGHLWHYKVPHPKHSDLYFSSLPLLLHSVGSTFHNLISIPKSYWHRGQVISTISSYSGSPRFRSQLQDRPRWTKFFVVSQSPAMRIPEQCLQISHKKFLCTSLMVFSVIIGTR
jgi:hypothetical protein